MGQTMAAKLHCTSPLSQTGHNLLGAVVRLSERLSADLAIERDAAHALSMRQEPLARGFDVVHVARRDHRPLQQIGVPLRGPRREEPG